MVSMLRGSDLARSLPGKVLDLVVGRPKDLSADASTPRKNRAFPPSPIPTATQKLIQH